jgi:hypothetical protein
VQSSLPVTTQCGEHAIRTLNLKEKLSLCGGVGTGPALPWGWNLSSRASSKSAMVSSRSTSICLADSLSQSRWLLVGSPKPRLLGPLCPASLPLSALLCVLKAKDSGRRPARGGEAAADRGEAVDVLEEDTARLCAAEVSGLRPVSLEGREDAGEAIRLFVVRSVSVGHKHVCSCHPRKLAGIQK